MIAKSIAPAARALLVTGLVVVGVLGAAACAEEEATQVPVEVTREVPVEVTVEVTREVPVEVTRVVPTVVVTEVPVEKAVPMTLSELAQAIQEGEIDVGTEYGIAFGQRYHTIHTTVVGLACTTCHISSPDTIQTLFTAQDVSPRAPGPVERSACLGCHRAGGPAHELYGSGSP